MFSIFAARPIGPTFLTAFSLSLSLMSSACSSASTETVAATPTATTTDAGAVPGDACALEATRCEGTLVQTCAAREGGAPTWSTPIVCPAEQGCRADACQDPTPRQKTQAEAVSALVRHLSEHSAWHQPVDAKAVEQRERIAILKGNGDDATYFAAAWRVMNAFPQGHQSLFGDEAVCGVAIPYQNASRFGVCGRPTNDGVVVTLARNGNALGLSAGDVIVRAGADEGEALLEASYLRPVCGAVFPAKSGRRAAGAASFFGHVPKGMVLSVRAPSGAVREMTVPDQSDAKATDCTDPFARKRRIYAEATTRPDGVAVIRLPSFYPFDKTLPATATDAQVQAYVDAYRARIVDVFDSVKTAPAIIWDARGNTGGLTPVGLSIVAGFSTARATAVSYCKSRSFGSSPPSFLPEKYASYEVTPGGPFAYAGKVAIVTDGLAYSAGDYFPLAALKASDAPVIGTASAGAYGGGNGPIDLEGPPALTCNYDPTACFDAATNSALEGAPPAPTVAVDYDPSDLAAGKDTLVERAVKALGF